MNPSSTQTFDASPDAGILIETLRSIGYDLETALCDILDNSIAAESTEININYTFSGADTSFHIADDGVGMDFNQMLTAMKPGSHSFSKVRKKTDLGKFGLGLKTASFSQTNLFSLSSKKNGITKHLTWDLSHVQRNNKWEVLEYCPNPDIPNHYLHKLESGTVVSWWGLDRLFTKKYSDSEKKKFLKQMSHTKKYIGMVYHEFIETNLKINLNDLEIPAWNPFKSDSSSLQTLPTVTLPNDQGTIKGYVLPHKSKISAEEYELGKGPFESWTAHQGFYLYRNKRIIIAGDWLGLFKKESFYDLCRIKIEINQNVDNDWQLDIKKSIARPPLYLRDILNKISADVRLKGIEVYKHKGKIINRSQSKIEFIPLWIEQYLQNKRLTKINRNHPIIKPYEKDKNIELMLRLIEESLPIPQITLQETLSNERHSQPFEMDENNEIIEGIKLLYNVLKNTGLDHNRIIAQISFTEPFNHHIEKINSINYEA